MSRCLFIFCHYSGSFIYGFAVLLGPSLTWFLLPSGTQWLREENIAPNSFFVQLSHLVPFFCQFSLDGSSCWFWLGSRFWHADRGWFGLVRVTAERKGAGCRTACGDVGLRLVLRFKQTAAVAANTRRLLRMVYPVGSAPVRTRFCVSRSGCGTGWLNDVQTIWVRSGSG